MVVDDAIRSLISTATYANTDTDASVLADPAPQLRLKPPGQVVDLRWRSAPSLMPEAVPRSIVNYREDDESANRVEGWAVITICPAPGGTGGGSADSEKAALEDYQAEGLELLLKQIVIDEPLYVEGETVYNAAYDFASVFKHPGYSTQQSDFTGNIGDVLDVAYAPEMTMFDFLTQLTQKFPDYIFYVDTDGYLHFELA